MDIGKSGNGQFKGSGKKSFMPNKRRSSMFTCGSA